jgi:hypothetical protein
MEIEKIDKNSFRLRANNEEIDNITKGEIKATYPIDEELAILRKTVKALINNEKIPDEFYDYNDFVEGVVNTNKIKKTGSDKL